MQNRVKFLIKHPNTELLASTVLTHWHIVSSHIGYVSLHTRWWCTVRLYPKFFVQDAPQSFGAYLHQKFFCFWQRDSKPSQYCALEYRGIIFWHQCIISFYAVNHMKIPCSCRPVCLSVFFRTIQLHIYTNHNAQLYRLEGQSECELSLSYSIDVTGCFLSYYSGAILAKICNDMIVVILEDSCWKIRGWSSRDSILYVTPNKWPKISVVILQCPGLILMPRFQIKSSKREQAMC